MEQLPNPEQRWGLECDNCGEDIWLTEETCQLQVYLDEDSYRHSFVVLVCGSKYECEPIYKFIEPEDIVKLDYLENTIITKRPDPDVLPFLESEYLKVYGEQAVELGVEPEVLVVDALLANWDAFIQYVEADEFLNDRERRHGA